MRFIFKTDYGQDIKLAKHGGHIFWYSLLMLLLLAAPWLVAEYWLAQLTFILIYAIAGLGLMLLAGFTGLFSLGHAAFLGVGAYTQAVMVNAGVPFPLAGVRAIKNAVEGATVNDAILTIIGKGTVTCRDCNLVQATVPPTLTPLRKLSPVKL